MSDRLTGDTLTSAKCMTTNTNAKTLFTSQEEVDTWYEEVKATWNAEVENSEQKEAMFIASSSEARRVLYVFSMLQQDIIEAGYSCPDLVDGVQIVEKPSSAT